VTDPSASLEDIIKAVEDFSVEEYAEAHFNYERTGLRSTNAVTLTLTLALALTLTLTPTLTLTDPNPHFNPSPRSIKSCAGRTSP